MFQIVFPCSPDDDIFLFHMRSPPIPAVSFESFRSALMTIRHQ
jgi:hypothetical protein